MESKQFIMIANCPSVDEFSKRFPQYGPYARGEGKILFDLLTTVENFHRMKVLTESDNPAVTGVAEVCYQEVINNSKEFTVYVKQFIGAVTCVVMESNGYEKANKKKAIPHPHFSKGEMYKKSHVK